jgi:hypothetical protein
MTALFWVTGHLTPDDQRAWADELAGHGHIPMVHEALESVSVPWAEIAHKNFLQLADLSSTSVFRLMLLSALPPKEW